MQRDFDKGKFNLITSIKFKNIVYSGIYGNYTSVLYGRIVSCISQKWSWILNNINNIFGGTLGRFEYFFNSKIWMDNK